FPSCFLMKGKAETMSLTKERLHGHVMKDSTSCSKAGFFSPTVDGWTCCPKGWRRFQGNCYFLSSDTMSWAESEQNCTGMGSQLVVINSEAEQVFTSIYETKYYIGLAAYKNGQWQWVDQTPYENTTTFWKPGEPNLLFAEKCAAIHVKGNTDPNTYSNWNNVLCFTSCYRICEQAVKLL
uniref:C-type lectin domain-containing protein n=1 Tax=Zosterops lateralis melanops TaxID=1220523 RepID=A0A8D2NXG1_ZOSLA